MAGERKPAVPGTSNGRKKIEKTAGVGLKKGLGVKSPSSPVRTEKPRSVKTRASPSSPASPYRRSVVPISSEASAFAVLKKPRPQAPRLAMEVQLTETHIETSKRETVEIEERHHRATLLCDMRVQQLIQQSGISTRRLQQDMVIREDTLQQQLDESTRKITELQQNCERSQEKQHEVEREIETVKRELQDARTELTKGEDEKATLKGEKATLESKKATLEGEKTTLEGEKATLMDSIGVYKKQGCKAQEENERSDVHAEERHYRTMLMCEMQVQELRLDVQKSCLDENLENEKELIESDGDPDSFMARNEHEGHPCVPETPNYEIGNLGFLRRHSQSIDVIRRISLSALTPRPAQAALREGIEHAISNAASSTSMVLEIGDQFTYALECGVMDAMRCNRLTSLTISKADLTNADLLLLKEEISQSGITHFSFIDGKVLSNVAEVFAGKVASMKHLRELSFEGTQFDDDGARHLARELGGIRSLTSVCFARCKGITQSWEMILSELASCTNLRKLEFQGTELPTQAIQYLSLLMRSQSSLVHVNVSRTGINKNCDGMTWLMDAVRAQHLACDEDPSRELCTLIITKDSLGREVKVEDGWTPLHFASFLNKPGKVAVLLDEAHQDVESRDCLGRTPVHLACIANATCCLEMMLEDMKNRNEAKAQVVVNYEDDNGMSALEAAASRCHIKCSSELINTGASVDSKALSSAIRLLMDYDDCVQKGDMPIPEDKILQLPVIERSNHRRCSKARKAVNDQLQLLSQSAHKPLRSVAVQTCLPGFLMYLVFLAVVTLSASTFSTHFAAHDFLSTKSLRDRMEGIESLNDVKESSLPDIKHLSTIPELWEWCDLVLMSVIDEAILSEGLDVVGGIRLRQVRVKEKPCGTEMCYGPFRLRDEDREAFDLGNMRWDWEPHGEPATLDPQLTKSYGQGGYSTLLPSHDSEKARASISSLRDMGWISDATRAVFTDLTFFKKNTGRFITCNLLFEISASGELLYTLQLVSIEQWSSEKNVLVLGLLCSVVVLLIDEVNDVRVSVPKWREEMGDLLQRGKLTKIQQAGVWVRKGTEHVLRAWNAADFLVIAMLAMAIYDMWCVHGMSGVWAATTEPSDGRFISFAELCARTRNLRDVLGLLVVIAWGKLLKYIAMLPVAGPAVNAIISTAVHADILTFMMLFMVISFSLSLGLHFTLGNNIEDFSSLTGSGLSFFRMVFGDFEVESFTAHTSVVGVMLFVTCLVTANFMLMNILIAVIGIQYEAQLKICSVQWEAQMIEQLQSRLSPTTPTCMHYLIPIEVIDSCQVKEPSLSSVTSLLQDLLVGINKRALMDDWGQTIAPASLDGTVAQTPVVLQRLQTEWEV